MSNLIQINNKGIQSKEFYGRRVITFKEIDLVHERPEGTAGRNFRENRNRFIEGVDYFEISPNEYQSDEIRRIGIDSPRGGYLITESGYLMLVKSFSDPLAWKVQRQLVNVYFRNKPQQTSSPLAALQNAVEVLTEHEERINLAEQKVLQLDAKVDSQITLTYNQAKEVQFAIKSRVIELLGGKDSDFYKQYKGSYFQQIHRDIKDRLGVPSYRDIRKIDYSNTIAYVKAWLPKASESA